ncbi:hypothetical protein [Nitrospirillum pindoramense]|uniref:Uncharacterized protein n=1 Tax=Nitrospirillum amazonense TaxID=28077 RepID=A0A560HH85_9PROT|nr:hypothetical protein [Nitrospirillum amazonense]TWB45795.1 hypothetical protein FBZ90_101128 [Nitrospirillum amazonense]
MIFTDANARPAGASTQDGRSNRPTADSSAPVAACRPRATVGRGLRALVLAGVVLSLGGCAGKLVPQALFHDGPEDPEPLANDASSKALLMGERPVRRVGPPPDVWPNLASVPERPKDVPDPATRQKDMDALLADRTAAGSIATDLTKYQSSPDQQSVQRATSSSNALFGGSSSGGSSSGAAAPSQSKMPVVPSAPPAVPGRVPDSVPAVPFAAPQVTAPQGAAAGAAASQAGAPAANGTSQTPQN